jgi:hypothetical protein
MSVLPGGGFALTGERMKALCVVLAIVLLMMISLQNASTLGAVCIGLAAALHMVSILRALPREDRQSFTAQIVFGALILLVLLLLIYIPFNRVVMSSNPENFRMVRRGYRASSIGGTLEGFLIIVPLFIGAAFAAWLVRSWLDTRRPRGSKSR